MRRDEGHLARGLASIRLARSNSAASPGSTTWRSFVQVTRSGESAAGLHSTGALSDQGDRWARRRSVSGLRNDGRVPRMVRCASPEDRLVRASIRTPGELFERTRCLLRSVSVWSLQSGGRSTGGPALSC